MLIVMLNVEVDNLFCHADDTGALHPLAPPWDVLPSFVSSCVSSVL